MHTHSAPQLRVAFVALRPSQCKQLRPAISLVPSTPALSKPQAPSYNALPARRAYILAALPSKIGYLSTLGVHADHFVARSSISVATHNPSVRITDHPHQKSSTIQTRSLTTNPRPNLPPPSSAPITSPQDPNAPSISPSSTTTNPTINIPTSSERRLTWNDFLQLRRSRRRYNLSSSLLTSLISTLSGISLLARQNIELLSIFGLDPFIVAGLATASSGAVGWLMGPFVGNAVFNFRHREMRGEIEAKERDLYGRIKKFRADPGGSSAGNPIPDYYGEKIGSVSGYKTWLKDQRAYERRRRQFL